MKAKLVQRNSRRFLKVGLLRESSPVLGSTAGVWDQALKGNLATSLQEVRRRVMAVRAQGVTNQPAPAEAPTDVASTVRRRSLARG